MPQSLTLTLSPADAADPEKVKLAAAIALSIPPEKINHLTNDRRSIDARQAPAKILLKISVYTNNEPVPPPPQIFIRRLPIVNNNKRAIVVGAGPAGLFAALALLHAGVKPILLERGKDIRERRRDLAQLNRYHIVNPESNYCFGEGGAGTYSDGKLYTRSNKRGSIRHILEIFVAHGANPDILTDAHPHIGTNKLPQIIATIRQTILDAGGEIFFQKKVTDLYLQNQTAKGVFTADGERYDADAVLLCTGHSARDVFELLHRQQIYIEAKPFAMGIRIEHPQHLIDQMQYKCGIAGRGDFLPPAAYTWTRQAMGRGVYSFCMCPGGIIAPCATDHEQVVTNGWSPSRRNNPFANSGIVVSVNPSDYAAFEQYGALAGMLFQAAAERQAWLAGGQTQTAPAQRLIDFLNRKASRSLPECSYQPGIVPSTLADVLPKFIAQSLHEALKGFSKQTPAYYTNEAVLLAIESRTSSPVRIPRHPDTLQHVQIKNLYPCGEGAGYAGGIVSAAIDGWHCAEKCGAII